MIYTARQLIVHFGHAAPSRRCSCCGAMSLFRVEYPQPRAGALFLCGVCDVTESDR